MPGRSRGAAPEVSVVADCSAEMTKEVVIVATSKSPECKNPEWKNSIEKMREYLNIKHCEHSCERVAEEERCRL